MFENIVILNKIKYGIIRGNNILMYIKVGNGGNIYGYQNKYFKIAEQIKKRYGYSVVVASNPVDMTLEDSIDLDMKFLGETFPEMDEIYAFGHSNGGQMLLTYAYRFPMIKKVVAVNSPLMINLHKTKKGIINYNGQKMIAIYGDKDPSCKFVELLNDIKSDYFDYVLFENADHNFTNMINEFINLPKEYLM